MNHKLSQIFKAMPEKKPESSLENRIFLRIEKERERQISKKALFYKLSLAGSGVAFLSVLAIFGKTFWQSDFWNIISLAFSDASLILSNWQSFGYSILENLPVIEIVAFLIPIFVSAILFDAYLKLDNKKILAS